MIIIEYFKDNKCNLFDLEIRKMHQNTNARKTFSWKLCRLIFLAQLFFAINPNPITKFSWSSIFFSLTFWAYLAKKF